VKDLVEFVARSLVDDPTQVQVIQTRQGGKVHLELKLRRMIWAESLVRVGASPMRSGSYSVLPLPERANRSHWTSSSQDEPARVCG